MVVIALNIGELTAFISVDSSKGTAAVSTFTRNMQSSAQSAASRFQTVGQSITGVGDNIAGVGGQLTRGITAPVGGAALAVGGLTAALGWGRLKSVDTAQAQLRGLGYETTDVERISDQLASALEGGMLTMGEATSAAAAGMASGVEEGKELTRYIQVLDGAVAGSNGTFDEMNQIFARVQGSGKLMTGELQMIEQRMPGFTATMAEGLGVPQEKLREMVSAGEISSDEFMDVMEDFAGDMATEYAKSWEGMVQNTKAYIGIIGEQLLGGVFEQSKESIAEFIEWMSSDEVQTWAAETGAAIGSAFAKILDAVKTVVTWFANLPAPVQKAALAFAVVAVAIGPVLLIIGKVISIVGMMVTTFGTIIGVVMKVVNVVRIVMTVLRALWLVMLANPIILIIAAVAAIVAALVWFFTQTETGKAMWQAFMDWLVVAWQWVKDTAVAIWDGIVSAIVGAWEWIRDKTAEIWNAVVTWIQENWDTITRILSLVNPVTAVIRNWDLIKAGTAAAWQWIKDKIAALWDGIKNAVSTAANWVKTRVQNIWNGIKSVTSNVWNGIKNTISNVWNGIRNAISNALNAVRNFISNGWNGAKRITSNAWSAMRNAVSNGISGVVGFVRGLPGRVLSALGNLGSRLYNSGWSMIDGFRRGIVNAFNNAMSAVRNGVQRIRNFFPFSPAKEGPFSGKGYTLYSGMALAEDFAKGMSMAESDVVRQAEAITKAAAFDVPDVPGMSGPSLRAGGSQGGLAASGVTNNFTVINPVAEPTSETARKSSAYIGVSV